jgi:hypothetical protein
MDDALHQPITPSGLDAASVNRLFDNAMHEFKKARDGVGNERTVFIEVLGDSADTQAAFSAFLHDVSSCPKPVVEFCQRLLADAGSC